MKMKKISIELNRQNIIAIIWIIAMAGASIGYQWLVLVACVVTVIILETDPRN